MPGIYDAFTQGRQNGEARYAKHTLSQHLMGAIGGDQAALAQVYQADPNAGMQAQKMARQTQQDDMGDVAKAADFYRKTGDPKAYAYLHQRLSSNPQFAGLPATVDTPEDQAGAKQFADVLVQTYGSGGQAGAVQSTFIDDTGNRVAVMRDGKTQVLGKAQANNQIVEGAGGFYGVNKGNMTATPVQMGGQAQQAETMPTRDGMEADIALANQMIAAGIPSEQVDAFITARGQRASEPQATQGRSLQQLQPAAAKVSPAEQVRLRLAEEANARAARAEQRQVSANAVTGKPPTEDERKAAGYAVRMEDALRVMKEVETRNKSANRPGYGQAAMDMLPDALANDMKSSDRQIIEAAQLDGLDAALTLATGAAYTKEQLKGLSKAYFPQPNDSEAAIADKQRRLQLVVETARIRAGRAAGTIDQVTGGRPAAGQSSGPVRIQSAADYEALPSGAEFITPDGQHKRKR